MRIFAGAHDPLSARLAELAGFDGIWASGLGLATSQTVPDLGLLGASETLQLSRNISLAVEVPVAVDCNDGFGDEATAAFTAGRAARLGLAGICVEDKVGAKTNSFRPGGQLAPLDVMTGRIKAAHCAVEGKPLGIVARTEALVVGRSVSEAVDRAEAYVAAGASGVLIHAKNPDTSALLETCTLLSSEHPDIEIWVIPTTFVETPRDVLQRAGVSVVVYANQSLRAAIRSMRRILDAIARGRLEGIDAEICPMADVFDLTSTKTYEDYRKIESCS